MKSGLVIYAKKLQPLIDFYCGVFEFSLRESDGSYAALELGDFELVILKKKFPAKLTLARHPKRLLH